MSLISFPALRGTGAHRSKPPAQLRRELNAATCDRLAQATEIDTLKAARDQLEAQLDAAGIELSGTRLDLEQAQAHITALRAQLANATKLTVPASQDDEQDTQPVDVRPLWDALGI